MVNRPSADVVRDLRTRAKIRRDIRSEGDKIAKQLDEAADLIEELEDVIKTIGEIPL
jgi:hypothetical protein